MLYDGSKTVAAAGTAEALADVNTPAAWVIITALSSNTDSIWVGGKTAASGRGVELLAGDSVTLPPVSDISPYDLSEIYVDADVNSEGVSYLYLRR